MALATATLVAQPAFAKAPPFVMAGDVMDAPRGFVEMCSVDRTFCSADVVASDPTIITGAVAQRNGAATDRGRSPIGEIGAEHRALVAQAAGPMREHGLRKLLVQINRTVNRSVFQESDMDQFGVAERWQRAGSGPTAAGDCEDIAIEKRFQLIAAGFPKDRLFFAVAYIPKVGLHTVLVARDDGGDLVLDNRVDRLRSWHDTRYVWLGVQSVSNPMIWRRVVTG